MADPTNDTMQMGPPAPPGHDDTQLIRERRSACARHALDVPPMAPGALPPQAPAPLPAAAAAAADTASPVTARFTGGARGHAPSARDAAAHPRPPVPATEAAPAPLPDTPAPPPAPAAPIWALALSGGGIRSATLSLGVLQAVAATHARPPAVDPAAAPATLGTAPDPGAATATPSPAEPSPPPVAPPAPSTFDDSLLSRFEYLSTVSGGGYIGGFLTSLFLPGRLRADARAAATTDPRERAIAARLAADDAVQALCHEPPGRMRANEAFEGGRVVQAPLRWLRDNGRYLTPAGGGDLFYAVALQLRNWIAVHYVMGTVLITLFAAMALAVSAVPWLQDFDGDQLAAATAALKGSNPGFMDGLWWSPWFLLSGALGALWVIPAGLSFWVPQPSGADGRCIAITPAAWGFVFLVGLCIGVADLHAVLGGLLPPGTGFAGWARALWDTESLPLYVALAVVIGLAQYTAVRVQTDNVDTMRVRLTRWLRDGMLAVGGLALLGVIDTAAHTLYLALASGLGTLGHALTPAGLVGALVYGVRHVAMSSSPKEALPAWAARLPWGTIAGAAGLVIMAVVATAWSLLVVALQWSGHLPEPYGFDPPDPRVMAMVLAVAVILTWVVGRFPSFINLSTLQAFYSARLARAYLGASNGWRFADLGKRSSWSVAEPHDGDDIALSAFVAPACDAAGAPQGQALVTRAPFHLLNVTINDTVDPAEQLVQRDRKGKPMVVTPLGFSIDGAPLGPFSAQAPTIELQRPLSLGQWVGTSGAAFSTGIGRETSLGRSLLMGAANVRLGTWWEPRPPGAAADRGSPDGVLRRLFPTQCYLLDEFTARFHGAARRWQYLSDGGHFENTALYELLRPERQVRFVIACDHGADPEYRFDDLANLIRLARIDLQVDVEVEESVREHPLLGRWFGVPADFRAAAASERGASHGNGADAHEPIAVLLRARHGTPAATTCWVLLLKPRVRGDSAADVVQYQLRHPEFPQEPTADQFYDEAQWESYRKLGRDNASHLLAPEVWSALHAWIGRQG